MQNIKKEIESHGIKISVVPVEVLKDIKKDIVKLRETENLNGFQKWLTNEAFVLELPDPEPDFTAKSIVVAITPRNITRGIFNYNNKKAEHIFDLAPSNTVEIINKAFTSNNYKIQEIFWFPQKLFSVRSGLSEYGRNNIAYADGMGSFFGIDTFKTDMPCDEYTWREAKIMDLCTSCNLCVEKCPTHAIMPERFLINNEKCLTAINENGTEPFPDWIPKTAHQCLRGCFICQQTCPKNKNIFANIIETVEFTKEETELLLSGKPLETLPQILADKIYKYEMNYFYESIPRNLHALLQNI